MKDEPVGGMYDAGGAGMPPRMFSRWSSGAGAASPSCSLLRARSWNI